MEIFGYAWWEAALMLAGVAGLGTAVLNLFFSVGDRQTFRTTHSHLAVDSPDFLLALSHAVNSPVEHGGEIKILRNGKEFLPALLRRLGEARQSVNITTYIWKKGEFSDALFPALLKCAERGVQIRILKDGLGGWHAPRRQLEFLAKAGARIASFRSPEFGKLTRLHRRNHRRAVVIDGWTGFTGGMAFEDKWLGDADAPGRWRDTMFEVTGRMARGLQAAFSDLWAASCGEIVAGREFYPLFPPDLPGPRFIHLASSPSDDTQPLPKFLWLSITAAERSLDISTPYFVPDRNFIRALLRGAGRGVRIRLLLPSARTDSRPVRWAAQSHYESLLAAGIRIFEYQPAMLHSKFFVADGAWSVVGSFNIDIRSKELNEENALGVLDGDFARRLADVFEDDLRESREISLASWRNRPLLKRGIQRLARQLEEQF